MWFLLFLQIFPFQDHHQEKHVASRFRLHQDGLFSFFSIREVDSTNVDRVGLAKRLTQLLQQKAIPRIPPHLAEKLAEKQVFFTFDPRCPGDAVFLEEATTREGTALEVCVRDGAMSERALNHLVVHEFFHALHFVVHPNEPAWMREGLAVWFEEWVLGEMNFGAVEAAMEQSSTPFFSDYNVGKTSVEQYGHNYLFFRYLSEKCDLGFREAKLLWRIVESSPGKYGEATLDGALDTHREEKLLVAPWCEKWVDVLLFFEIARVHNRTIYEPSESSVFTLIRTTRRMKRSEIDWTKFETEKWERYRPMVLSLGSYPDEMAPVFGTESWKRVYLHDVYPYEIEKELPQKNLRSKEWSELWIKM